MAGLSAYLEKVDPALFPTQPSDMIISYGVERQRRLTGESWCREKP